MGSQPRLLLAFWHPAFGVMKDYMAYQPRTTYRRDGREMERDERSGKFTAIGHVHVEAPSADFELALAELCGVRVLLLPTMPPISLITNKSSS